jgi:methionine synthase I (cobalamin-dependent)
VNGRSVYDLSPEAMAAAYADILAVGANVVGACCGSTPEHIRRITQVVRGLRG